MSCHAMRVVRVVVVAAVLVAAASPSRADAPADEKPARTATSDANGIARYAFMLSMPNPLRRPPDTYSYVRACLAVPACSETCRLTIQAAGTSKPAPSFDCPETNGKTRDEIVDWLKARFSRVMLDAKANVDAANRDFLDCAIARLLKQGSTDACLRTEPDIVRQQLESRRKMDPRMANQLSLKECANLEGCSGACSFEIGRMMNPGLRVLLDAPSKCTEFAMKPNESVDDWSARWRPTVVKRIEAYYRGITSKLPEAQRASFRESLAYAGF